MRRNRRDAQGDQPRRGSGAPSRRRPDTRTDSERIAAVAHEAQVPVEDVLREVADFRLALETDMIIAAAAADAESEDLLSEVVDGERIELATFHDRLLERLADAAAADEIALRRARNARTGKSGGRTARWVAAAAAAVTILGTGGAAMRSGGSERQVDTNSVALATASQQYADLSNAVNNESPTELRDAAAELHETLEQLISEHAGDPEVAHRAATLLQAEISLLQSRDPEGARQVIAQARSLVKMLRGAAPPQVRATVAPILDAVATPSSKPKPSSSPKATAKPTPKETPKPSTAAPTPTQSPSASRSAPGDTGQNPLDSP